jgi:hypothetical protein
MSGYYSGEDLGGEKLERNRFLAESDQYVLADHPTTKKAAWKIYRTSLRDMDFSDLENLNWPEKPE